MGVAHLKFSDDRKLDLVSLDFTPPRTTRTEADGCFNGVSDEEFTLVQNNSVAGIAGFKPTRETAKTNALLFVRS